MRTHLLSALAAMLFLTSAVVADPVITSVSPSSGPVTGGTTVLIQGTGFSDNCIVCSPPFADPRVSFGNVEALSTRFISPTLLEAVTPPGLPGRVSVTVFQYDGSQPYTLLDGFAYFGEVYEGFDPLLFPIFMPPVRGANGSEFRTTARIWNKSLDQPVTFYGYDSTCLLADPPIYPGNPVTIPPRGVELDLLPECSSSVGKLLYVPRGDRSLAASLRVWETSRQGENHGVEIPVVRLEDFSEESVGLLDVPTDPKYRLTLRIYGLNRGESFVNVSFLGRLLQVPLPHGASLFEPSYAVVSDLIPPLMSPAALPDSAPLLVEVPRGPGGVHIPGTPIWAFVTVTNNETQHITTITPQ